VKRLEEWLGLAVCDRRPTGFVLTAEGEALSRHLTPALGSLADLCDRLKADSAEQQVLTVGCIASIASRWLIPALPDFAARHPDIGISVHYAQAQQAFDPRQLDILITLGRDDSDAVESRVLLSRANRPVCSPHYLAKVGPLEGPAAIARADLLHDESRLGWAEWLAAAGLAVPASPAGPVFQDFNLLATALIAGHGMALCPIAVVRDELRRGDLVVLSDIATLAEENYVLITRAAPSRKARAFRDWFVGWIDRSS